MRVSRGIWWAEAWLQKPRDASFLQCIYVQIPKQRGLSTVKFDTNSLQVPILGVLHVVKFDTHSLQVPILGVFCTVKFDTLFDFLVP